MCDGNANFCPNCGPDFFQFEREREFVELQEVFNANRVEFPYNKILGRSHPLPHMPCIRGEIWDGSDFLLGSYVSGGYVTGRVVKWLVDNQYGPVLLIPYPLDVSRCDTEQMNKINQIRYCP